MGSRATNLFDLLGDDEVDPELTVVKATEAAAQQAKLAHQAHSKPEAKKAAEKPAAPAAPGVTKTGIFKKSAPVSGSTGVVESTSHRPEGGNRDRGTIRARGERSERGERRREGEGGKREFDRRSGTGRPYVNGCDPWRLVVGAVLCACVCGSGGPVRDNAEEGCGHY